MKRFGAQITFSALLVMMLASIGMQISGYMEGRLSFLYDQSNKLYPEINKLESAAYSVFNKDYPLDLDTTNYHDLKMQVAEIEKNIKDERKLKRFVGRMADASAYTIVPYAIFSLAFIFSVGRNRTRRVRPSGYGIAFATLACITMFCYFLQAPPRCRDFGCLYSLLTISASILILGTIVNLATAFVVKRIQGAG